MISVIVPTLNEGALIEQLLGELQALRSLGHQIILSDGGSEDDTRQRAAPWVDHLVVGEAGRGVQMNRGAALASGDVLWFLHADTGFARAPAELAQALQAEPLHWGFCRIRLDAPSWPFRIIEWFINQRSGISRIGSGDQGLFIRRELFQQLGGFASIPLMEDIELSKRLRLRHPPRLVAMPLLTSARRWQQRGVVPTVLLMWRLRLGYFLGVPAHRLAAHYRLCSSPTRES